MPLAAPLLSLALIGAAHAELSPADNEPGFRIYDVLTPSTKPKSGGATARSTSEAQRAQGELRGKLLVVGDQDLEVGDVVWAKGSNYWFWSPDPTRTGADPCKDLPRAKMASPSAIADFAIRLAVDGAKGGKLADSGALTGTTCMPEQAARGPSRVFDHHQPYEVKGRLSGHGGTLYRMSLLSGGKEQAIGYAYHDPSRPDFSDPGRFGWLLEATEAPAGARSLGGLALGQVSQARSSYRVVQQTPRGIVDLDERETLIFRVTDSYPEEATGVNTIDLLLR
jgi:hypothetical protein